MNQTTQIQPTKQMIDGQYTLIFHNCIDCQKTISQSELVEHLEKNHDVFYSRKRFEVQN
jgi:hypothetical protein